MSPTTTKKIFKSSFISNPQTNDWLKGHAVIVEDNLISGVLHNDKLPKDIAQTHEVIDLGKVFLIPGLIETHAHMHCAGTKDTFNLATSENNDSQLIRAANNLSTAVYSGVTTLRDLGSKNEIAFSIKKSIQSKIIKGPKLILSGTPITTTAGHCHFFATEADTKEEVLKAIRQQIKLGAEIIKIMASGGGFTPRSNRYKAQYTSEIIKAAVVETERLGIPIAAHAHATESIKQCVDAGVKHIIHSSWLSENSENGEDYDQEITKEMAEKNIWIDPGGGLTLLRRENAPDYQMPNWTATDVSGDVSEKDPEHDNRRTEILLDMHDKGVKFLGGLDVGMAHAHFDNTPATAWFTVENLGFSPWEGIQSITSNNAEGLGINNKVGNIKVGLNADLISFKKDPSKDIRNLHHPNSVILDGNLIKFNHKLVGND
jgi:imidazolonepropionase-like amidohydrolase